MMAILHRKTERHVTQIQKHKTRTKSIQQRKTRKTHKQVNTEREKKKNIAYVQRNNTCRIKFTTFTIHNTCK